VTRGFSTADDGAGKRLGKNLKRVGDGPKGRKEPKRRRRKGRRGGTELLGCLCNVCSGEVVTKKDEMNARGGFRKGDGRPFSLKDSGHQKMTVSG